jgi:hypothetical protein
VSLQREKKMGDCNYCYDKGTTEHDIYILSPYHHYKQNNTDYFEFLIIDHMRRRIHACAVNSRVRTHITHAISSTP